MANPEITNLKQDLLTELGPMPKRPDLDLQILSKRVVWAYEEWKIEYTAEAGDMRQAVTRIPAYILIPKWQGSAPFPGMVALHQCNVDCTLAKEAVVGKTAETTPDQHYAVELVNEGFVVIAPDSINCGERNLEGLREAGESKLCFDQLKTILGRSFHGKQVFDVSRAVDVLESLDFVDSSRIGLIGHSMGAHTGLHTMAYDERIRACILSGTFPSKYLPLHAPRLHIALRGALDIPQLNPESVNTFFKDLHGSYEHARAYYQSHGLGDHLDLQIKHCGHHFEERFKWDAFRRLRTYFNTAPVQGPVDLGIVLERARNDNWAWDRSDEHFPPIHARKGLMVWGNEATLNEGFKFLLVHAYLKLDASRPQLSIQVKEQQDTCEVWCAVPSQNLAAKVSFMENGEKFFIASNGTLRTEIDNGVGYFVVTLPNWKKSQTN